MDLDFLWHPVVSCDIQCDALNTFELGFDGTSKRDHGEYCATQSITNVIGA